jgi:hypothetical protein
MRTRVSLLLALVLALGFAAGQVFSRDDTSRALEDWEKAIERNSTPGPEHAQLKALEGNFEVYTKAVVDPSEPAREAKGTCEDRVIFGGLFVKEDFEGTCPFTGKALRGVSYTGFDRAKGKYVQTWVDSLSSGIMFQEGKADPSGKVITFNRTSVDPVTGREIKTRSVLTIVDEDKHTYEMFRLGPAGKEFRALALTYIRK